MTMTAADASSHTPSDMRWAQVVRGEHQSIPAVHPGHSPPSDCSTPEQASFHDCFDGNVGGEKPKKAAWTNPLINGVAEEMLMEGSWPALSESTKVSSKIVSDGSTPCSQGHVIPHSPHKQTTSNAKPNSTTNLSLPARQRSLKRGDGGNGSGGEHSQNRFTHLPPPPPFPVFGMPPNGYGHLVSALADQSLREHTCRSNNWEPRLAGGFVPQPPLVPDHRHYSRRGKFGSRGDGSYHNNYRARCEQDHGHNGNARDVHVRPQRPPSRGFVRHPPPTNAAFVPPQPVRLFPNPMGFPDFVYVPTLPLPFITNAPSPPAMPMPVPEASLPAMLIRQIEYYFSDANIINDDFLKSNMDDRGWVPITLIAGFNRVKKMTNDIPLILNSLRTSTFLEVQDEKVRRRNDWMKWMSSSSPHPIDSGLQSSTASSYNVLTSSFQN